jgi:DNA-binding response OmpR family regulator
MLLVAISGWGQDEDKRRATEAGFDRHLTKPVEFNELDNLIAAASGETERFAARRNPKRI